LNCPYRKRNKQRFNIRDHVRCTKSFKNLSALKFVSLDRSNPRYPGLR
jgi:hypothetical protein